MPRAARFLSICSKARRTISCGSTTNSILPPTFASQPLLSSSGTSWRTSTGFLTPTTPSSPTRAGPCHGGLSQQESELAAGDGAAAGLHQQHVLLEQLAHQVVVGGILGGAWVVAADVGHHAPDAAGHDGVVQRAERGGVAASQHGVDVLLRD